VENAGGEVREVKSVGLGLTAIPRIVFENVAARTLNVKSLRNPRSARAWFATTDPKWDDMESDDFAFCRRVREAGMAIYADSRHRVEHVGLESFALEDAEQPKIRAETVVLRQPSTR
jgi:2-polyprenyl-6-methoxyphenol hydroxylase-like FAD-dependent oxidoreductase